MPKTLKHFFFFAWDSNNLTTCSEVSKTLIKCNQRQSISKPISIISNLNRKHNNNKFRGWTRNRCLTETVLTGTKIKAAGGAGSGPRVAFHEFVWILMDGCRCHMLIPWVTSSDPLHFILDFLLLYSISIVSATKEPKFESALFIFPQILTDA